MFGILVYKGDLFDSLQSPLYKSLAMYEDNPAGPEAVKIKKEAFKQIWNTVQRDVNDAIDASFDNDKYLDEMLWSC